MMTLKERWAENKIKCILIVLITYGVPVFLFIKGFKPMWWELPDQPEGLFISFACYFGGYLWFRASYAWFQLY
jgi:hypothetical protein